MDTSGDETEQRVRQQRDRSSISFPYVSLADAITVARALHNAGGLPCARDQLAGAMGQAPGSGNFGLKLGAARLFGLIETLQNKYQLTELGFAIVDGDEMRQRGAKVTAFLNVPLYRKVYDEFRNRQLPPRPLGLEQAFVQFGVAPKQKANARYAFDHSAEAAGFFERGDDRLIAPIVVASQPEAAADLPAPEAASRATQSTATASLSPVRHPFIEGLLQTLPNQPGDTWATDARVKWLRAAANIFDILYKGGAPIQVEISAEPHQKTTE